jgi:hypothetical protein
MLGSLGEYFRRFCPKKNAAKIIAHPNFFRSIDLSGMVSGRMFFSAQQTLSPGTSQRVGGVSFSNSEEKK